MFCQNCGASIADGAKFCPECGSRQEPAAPSVSAQNRCPFCGQALDTDSVFCDNCGKKLDGQTAVNMPKYSQIRSTPRAETYSRPGSTQTRPRTRSVHVSASPEMRILGIPVRGKAMWIVLAVIAVAVIGLTAYAKFGLNGEAEDETAQTVTFSAREDAARTESAVTSENTSDTVDIKNSFLDRLQESEAVMEVNPEDEPEQMQEPVIEAEPKTATEPDPLTEPEVDDVLAALPYVDSLGAPAATDFAWIADEQSGALTGSFLRNDELVGKWKGEILFDGAWELVCVTIDTNGRITIEPYQINYGEGWENETGDEAYLFDGDFDINRVYGSGEYGSIDLYIFLESNGIQYGVGTFSVNTGESAKVYLVRP